MSAERFPLNFERFVARRYLFSGKKKASFSAITLISVLGVALGVYALIVVIAVMDGFDRNLMEKFIGASSHITVDPAWAGAPAIQSDVMLEKIRAVPGVHAAAPVIQRLTMLTVDEGEAPQRQAGVLLQGVDFEHEPNVTKLMDDVVGDATPEARQIVVGRQIVEEQLYARLQQPMKLFTARIVDTPSGPVPAIRTLTLAGTFKTGFPQSDEMMAYIDINYARQLFGVPDDYVDGLRVSVKNLDDVDAVAKTLRGMVGENYRVTTWLERNAMLFSALRLEKWAMFIILLLVVLIAAFNIIGILTMIVLEKTREIGILKSMGATEGSILRVFLNQGLAIGAAGITAGAVAGLATCFALSRIRLEAIGGPYLDDRIPVLVTPVTVALILGSSLAIVLLASLLPARQAARLDPVEALRYE